MRYERLDSIPKITQKTVQLAFRALTDNSKTPGRKPSDPVLNEFEQLYQSQYQYTGFKKVKGTNLSHIINDDISKQIVTVLETNIREHFPKYISRYLKALFLDFSATRPQQKVVKNELIKVKHDLMTGTLTSDPKYHEWIKGNRIILPVIQKENHYLEVVKDPQSYLPSMLYISRELEMLGRKSYGVFPLRTGCYPKYVPFSTSALIELLVDKDVLSGSNTTKSYLLTNGTEHRHWIWNQFFKLNYSIFKWDKGITFDYRVQTDGLYASLQFIACDQVDKKAALNTKRKEAQRRARDVLLNAENTKDNIIIDEIADDIIIDEIDDDIIIDEMDEITGDIITDDIFEEGVINNDIIEEGEDYAATGRQNSKFVWKYLENLSEVELSEIRSKGFVVGDPGKDNLLVLLDNNGNVVKFTNCEKVHLTGQHRLRKKLDKFRKNKGILKIEEELGTVNSKSCFAYLFYEFIIVKNRVNSLLSEKYENEIFRKLRWYGHVNKKRYYKEVGRRIKEKFGDRPIFYGDWDGRGNLRGKAPTPGIGLKRIISRTSKVYNLDEFRTSALSHVGEERCNNLEVLKDGRVQSVHAILTYKTLSGGHGCIGRDLNAVRNMCKIVCSHLDGDGRPYRFRRGVKLDI